MLKGLPLSQAPFTNGLIWMIDISIGLGTGKIVAVLASMPITINSLQAALCLEHVHCLGVSVAASWTGDTIADVAQAPHRPDGPPSRLPQRRGQRAAQSRRLTG